MSRLIPVILIMALVGPGCAPKRVAGDGSVVTAPEVGRPFEEPARTPPDTAELPSPEPLARSGTSVLAPKRTAPAGLGPRAVTLAKAQLGKPYQWGAAGPNRFDCSGLVQYVYSNLGVPLPRVSRQQASAGKHVERRDLQAGDLVFFRLGGSRIDHVGIYVGRGRFIHAPNRDRPVRYDDLNDSWWSRRYGGARRIR